MKIIIKRLAVLTLCVSALSWGGYRLWLKAQPEDFQAMMHSMSLTEFWRITYETLIPRQVVDYAGFERRDYEDRGHSPWVLRSSLDGISRMIHFALAPGYWLSYHTESGTAYQFWQGDLLFQGPAYDTYHGREPVSEGRAFFRDLDRSPWLLGKAGDLQTAEVSYLGHFYRDGGQQAGIRLRLSSASQEVVLTEIPEIRFTGNSLQLERRFHVEQSSSPELQVALHLPQTLQDVSGNGIWREELRLLQLNPGQTLVQLRFETPTIDIAQASDRPGTDERATGMPAAMLESDCASCHHEQEQIVGPSYRQIADHYAGQEPARVIERLAKKILRGGTGNWGELMMPAHPELSEADARAMADYILGVQALAPEADPQQAEVRERFTWTYEADVEDRPQSLHPGLQSQRLEAEGFTPMVGGLSLLSDGRLLVVTWDPDGAAYVIDNWQDSSGDLRVKRFAEGLQEPLGLTVVDDNIYVMQKQEITQLIDKDGDDWVDEYRTINNDWQASSNFHEFGFGLVHHQGYLYGGLSACVEFGGKSCPQQLADRGKVFRVSLATGKLEFVAGGLRTPNGFGLSQEGGIFITDNQGDWLPSSKLLHLKEGAFYGWRSPAEKGTQHPDATPPVLWLPQNEVGNSPTQPLQLREGPYAGQWLFGDVYNGGIKRAFVEKVNDQYQGAAFHFTAGLNGGVNRLLEAPNGDILVGEIGNPGNWGDIGKQWYGLERLRFTSAKAFEPKAIRATATGFSIELTEPLAADSVLDPESWRIQQWFYHPSAMYGGPKYDLQTLTVGELSLSGDRQTLHLSIAGLEAGHVVYLRLPKELRSVTGQSLWVNEAWYTLNQIPSGTEEVVPSEHNRLSADERSQGWRLLFDGASLDGWRNFGAEKGQAIRGWVVENGSLKMTRETSFFRFVLNYLNPFTDNPLLDLMSEQRFAEFELSVDWKISPGGNSGIFYLVPDDRERVPWKKGLEMQVLDNDGHPDGKKHKHRAGDLYDIKASRTEPVKPVGQWNTARVRVKGDRIQHWLNGVEVVDVQRLSPEWQRLLAESKFADWEGYGEAREGHIVLQDHGDTVWYRNIKIRPLSD